MLAVIILVCVCVVLLAVLGVMKKSSRQSQEPPGPWGWPYFGQAFSVSADSAHLKFSAWSKEYGDLYMITMFGRKILVLNNPDIIRKAFVERDLAEVVSDRPPSFIGHFIADGYKDVLFRKYDDICRKLKAVTLKAMFSAGEGSELFHELAAKEYQNYVTGITSSSGRNIDILKPLESSLCKMIGLMFTGKLLAADDPILTSIEEFDHYGNEMIMPTTHLKLKVMPFLRYLPGRYGDLYRSLMQARENMRIKLLQKTKEDFKSEKRNCLLHALFKIQDDEDWLTDDYILGVIMDLINTSTLTSRGVLSGFLFLLTHFQDMQQKICAEIDAKIEKSRTPKPEDLSNMPYTHACVMEVLRYQSHLGLTATHTNSTDICIEGYFIPKGSSIYGNQWNVHHDNRFWTDPWEFRPERFLTDNGQLIPSDSDIKSRFYMPFGVGNRSCMGVRMTYSRMFMYITTLLQNHVILPPSDRSLPSHDPRHLVPGTVLQAPEFLCRILPR